jgi:hypothetical protein
MSQISRVAGNMSTDNVNLAISLRLDAESPRHGDEPIKCDMQLISKRRYYSLT